MSETKNELVQLCGLWRSRDGQSLSGNFTFGSRVVIFPNGYKRNDKDPDYILYIQKNHPKEKLEQAQEQDKAPF